MSEAYDSIWRRWRFTPWRDILRGRITGRLDRKRIIAQSGLPAPAVDCIHNVVKRTRLWRLEKSQVAQELIAHFADGLEAGHSADELLESFGDPRQAARLIRRAKIRLRPLPWHVIKWTRRALAVVLLLYAGLAAMYFMQSPRVTTDYLPVLNRVASSLEEDERAWPLYAQALLGLGVDRFRDEIDRASRPGDEHWDELVAYMQAHHEDIELIREASQRPGLGYVMGFQWDEWMHRLRPDEGEQMRVREQDKLLDKLLYVVPLPTVSLLHRIARLLAADAHLATLNGEPDRAYDDIVAMFAIAEHARETPLLINGLVCVHIHTLAYRLTSDLLQEHPEVFTNDQLRDLAHRIGRINGRNLITFEGERASFYDVVQRIFSDDGHGDGYLTSVGFQNLKSMRDFARQDRGTLGDLSDYLQVAARPAASRFTMASRREVVVMHDHIMDTMEREFHIPMREQPTSTAYAGFDNWSEFDRHAYMPLTIFMPALSRPLRVRIERYEGTQDGVLIGIALQRYHREHGRWPDTLDELSPALLPQVPVDRITGGPLHYRIVDDRPMVYSVGVDLDDDGGRMVHVGNEGPGLPLGEPRNEHTAQWLTDEQRETQTPPDGDWLLWPIVPE